jgi:hypothetical protein
VVLYTDQNRIRSHTWITIGFTELNTIVMHITPGRCG